MILPRETVRDKIAELHRVALTEEGRIELITDHIMRLLGVADTELSQARQQVEELEAELEMSSSDDKETSWPPR